MTSPHDSLCYNQDDIVRLRSLLPYFTSDHISLALNRYPDVIEDAIPSISSAMLAPSLPTVSLELQVAQSTIARSSLERLRKCFSDPQFWIQSSFTKEQLDSIRLAFMQAMPKHDQRTCAASAKQYESRRKTEIVRMLRISKK